MLGVALYPRLSHFATDVVMAAFIGIELVGATMMIRRSRCRTA